VLFAALSFGAGSAVRPFLRGVCSEHELFSWGVENERSGRPVGDVTSEGAFYQRLRLTVLLG